MGVHVWTGEYDSQPAAGMIDSVSGFTFGPVFKGCDQDDVDDFIAFVHRSGVRDVRQLEDSALADAHLRWLREREDIDHANRLDAASAAEDSP